MSDHRLTGEAFGRLFDDFTLTAFRLETRDRYNIPGEQESLRRFLAGELDPARATRPWLAKMRAATAEGKRVERVRVISRPHSDYVRFLLAGTPYNLEAGEDIRYLPRDTARAVGLPEQEFWLFDSIRAAFLDFDDDDRFLGAEITDDPARVVRCCRWRDLAWKHAVAYREYVGS